MGEEGRERSISYPFISYLINIYFVTGRANHMYILKNQVNQYRQTLHLKYIIQRHEVVTTIKIMRRSVRVGMDL